MYVRKVFWVVTAAALVLFSGCVDLPSGKDPLSNEEAGDRAETAMQSFAAAMSTREGGEIKRFSGDMEGKQSDDGLGLGDMDIGMEVIWGANDVIKAAFDMKMGGMTFSLVAWCTPTQSLVEWGETVFASRPIATADSDELCPGLEDTEMMQGDGLAFFEGEEFEDLVKDEITVHDDGTITAVFRHAEEDGVFTVHLDRKGRVTGFDMEDAEMTGAFTVEYGDRDTLTPPGVDSRIPATIYAATEYTNEGETGTITHAPEAPPLGQIEARLVKMDWDTGHEFELGIFALDGERHSAVGYSFRYIDEDGDGRVSENDTYEFTRPDNTDLYGVDIQFYDLWAEGYANDMPLPAPGIALILVGLLGALGVAMRMRRPA